jgi:hypothetical protein
MEDALTGVVGMTWDLSGGERGGADGTDRDSMDDEEEEDEEAKVVNWEGNSFGGTILRDETRALINDGGAKEEEEDDDDDDSGGVFGALADEDELNVSSSWELGDLEGEAEGDEGSKGGVSGGGGGCVDDDNGAVVAGFVDVEVVVFLLKAAIRIASAANFNRSSTPPPLPSPSPSSSSSTLSFSPMESKLEVCCPDFLLKLSGVSVSVLDCKLESFDLCSLKVCSSCSGASLLGQYCSAHFLSATTNTVSPQCNIIPFLGVEVTTTHPINRKK